MSGLRTPDCSPLPQACGLLTLPGCGKSQRRLRHVSFQTRSSSGVASAALRSAVLVARPGARSSRVVHAHQSSCSGSGVLRNTNRRGPRLCSRQGRSPPSLQEIRVAAPCSGRCDLGLEAGERRPSGARCALLAPRLSWRPLTEGLTGTASRPSLLGWSCWSGPTGLVWLGVLGIWVVESSSVLRSLPLA